MYALLVQNAIAALDPVALPAVMPPFTLAAVTTTVDRIIIVGIVVTGRTFFPVVTRIESIPSCIRWILQGTVAIRSQRSNRFPHSS